MRVARFRDGSVWWRVAVPALFAGIAVVAAVLAVPRLVSHERFVGPAARAALEASLSDRMAGKVELGEMRLEASYNPVLVATDATFTSPDADATVRSVRLRLNLLSALRGRLDPEGVRLEGVRLRGRLPRMNAAAPIELVDARFERPGASPITAISGSVTPAPDGMLAVLQGELNDVATDLELRTESDRTAIQLRSDHGTFRFDGKVTDGRANGRAVLNAPSARSFAAWLGFSRSDALPAEPVAVDTSVIGTFDPLVGTGSFDLPDADTTLAEAVGSGVLTLRRDRSGRLRISGTLAFGALSLNPATVQPFPFANAAHTGFELAALSAFDLDLRASMDSLALGSLSLANVAASLRTSADGVRVDIGDARTLDGTLAASLFIPSDGELLTTLELSGTTLNSAALAAGGAIAGTGDLELTLAGTGPARTGNGRLRLKPATLNGIDLPAAMTGAASSGTTAVTAIDVPFLVRGSRILLAGARLRTPNFQATLSGRAELRGDPSLDITIDTTQLSRPDAKRSVNVSGTLRSLRVREVPVAN